MTWADIDFENLQIHITPKEDTADTLEWEPKDLECRTVPLPEKGMQLLADLQAFTEEGCPYVFVPAWRWRHIQQIRKAGRWPQDRAIVNNLGRQFDKLRRRASVAKCTLHDLRRSCITNWARVLPVHVVQKLAGHSDMKTTQKYYLTVREEDLKRARRMQSKILRSNLTDPKLTHFGQNARSSEKAIRRNLLADKDLK